MPFPDGKALKRARDKRGWTQEQLRDAAGIDVKTISNIEGGKRTRVQGRTLENLARALDVSPESLCKTNTSDQESEVLKVRIRPAARNALALVARRYRMHRDDIVAVAPLLFFIAAEQSLQRRQKQVDEMRKRATSLFDIYNEINHLPLHCPVDETAVESEEKSIKDHDLFGKFTESTSFLSDYPNNYDHAERNPFVTFLRDSLRKVTSSDWPNRVERWDPDLWPEYRICEDEAKAIVGDDYLAAFEILDGHVAVHDLPRGSPADRAAWVRAEHKRTYGSDLSILDFTDEDLETLETMASNTQAEP